MYFKKRRLFTNNHATHSLLETLISLGLTVSFITMFFISFSDIYETYDTPDVDLQAKANSFMEKLLSSPGENSDSSELDELLNLGTSPTMAYGIGYRDPMTHDFTIVGEQYSHSDVEIGVIDRCFLQGTKILMADDSYKNIENIQTGDNVQSYDVENDIQVVGCVSEVFHYPADDMIYDCYLVINDALSVTPNHCFYSEGDWVYAGDLEVGDFLFDPPNNVLINSVERVYEKKTLYDFEVLPCHDYFVKIDENYDVLVHNPEVEWILKADPSPGEAGVIIKEPDKPSYNDREEVCVNAEANDGWVFDHWNGEEIDGSIEPSVILIMDSDKAVTAVFVEEENNNYILNLYWTGSGSIIQDPDLDEFPPGTNVNLTAVPADENWVFDHWTGDLTGDQNPDNITMDSNKQVTAHFTLDPNAQINVSAAFTWFDKDGLGSEKEIYFNAADSWSDEDILMYSWDFDGDGLFDDYCGKGVDYTTWKYQDDEEYEVTLKLTALGGLSDICVHTVQANGVQITETDTPEDPDIDVTNENIGDTIKQEDEQYFTSYTQVEETNGYYVYEIKNNKRTDYKILNYNSINNLNSNINSKYNDIKTKLNLDTQSSIYNFNIEIKDESDDTICSGGATNPEENTMGQKTITRKILIYYPPTVELTDDDNPVITEHPNYKIGEISVSLFIGGTPPS